MRTHIDGRLARRINGFFMRALRHVQGECAGQPFALQDWQREIVTEVFARLDSRERRAYTHCYIEVPRGNGKSTLAAGMALYALVADPTDHAPHVYSVAADREQARIVFDVARQMVIESPVLSQVCKVERHAIYSLRNGGVYRVLSSDADSAHGLQPSCVVFDELHAQDNRDLWDAIATAMGKRPQPLLVMLTTAGHDRHSICYEQHEYARAVLSGAQDDPRYFARIWAADDGDDWTSPDVWRKANPNWGVTVREDFLRSECERAKRMPGYQPTFRRLYLNQWVQQESRWLSLDEWDACRADVDWAAFDGAVCYGGLDLASTSDLAAFVLVFPRDGRYYVMPRFWVPAEALAARALRDRVPYETWAASGYIIPTPGSVIDYDRIVLDVVSLAQRYRIAEIAFDRWGAVQVQQRLSDAGLVMVQFGQGFASMSAPARELARLIASRSLVHDGHPVLRWNAGNVVVESDAAGNLKPSKSKSREKIDGIVALLMALDRAMRHGARTSVYDERGIMTL